jgi:hypothetical protein
MVIVFENRKVGNTSTGIKPFFAKQFDYDIGKLMNALKVLNECVLEYSLGLFVDQQLVVIYPEKADSAVLIDLYCDGKKSIPTKFRNLEIVI